jgi:hypothetical protein
MLRIWLVMLLKRMDEDAGVRVWSKSRYRLVESGLEKV